MTSSYCLICGNTDVDDRLKNLDEAAESILLDWDKICAASFCNAFRFDSSIRNLLLRSVFCQHCKEILREIDFLCQSIQRFREKLRWTFKSVHSSVEKTFNIFSQLKYRGNDRTYLNSLRLLRDAFTKRKSNIEKGDADAGQTVQSVTNCATNMRFRIPLPEIEELKFVTLEIVPQASSNLAATIRKGLKNCQTFEYPLEIFNDGGDNSERPESLLSDHENPDQGNFQSMEPSIYTKTYIDDPLGSPKTEWNDALNVQKQVHDNKLMTNFKLPSKPVVRTKKVVSFKCRSFMCPLAFKTIRERSVHMKDVHNLDGNRFYCKECPPDTTSFKYPMELVKHKREHRLRRIADVQPCQYCGREFKNKDYKQKHIEAVHPYRNMSVCSVCSKMFANSSDLKEHEELHQSRKTTAPFACVLCDNIYTSRYLLKNHVMETHEDMLLKNKCTVCGKVFGTREKLHHHSRVIHRERSSKWKCTLCSYVGSSPSSLKYHSRVHTKEREFMCPYCGKMYTRQNALNYHFRRCPTETRAFPCTLCPKRFISRRQLHCHEETHSGKKNYVCDTCGHAFYSRSAMKNHVRRVHEGYKYKRKSRSKKIKAAAVAKITTSECSPPTVFSEFPMPNVLYDCWKPEGFPETDDS